MNWESIEPWNYIVDSVSYEYKKKFKDIDIEDIRQELYRWFVEHPNKLESWVAIGEKDAKNLIYRSLRNQALDYCNHWKAKSGGFEVSDLYYYEAGMVEALLPSVLMGHFSTSVKLDLGKTSGGGAPSEGGNVMAMMIEIDYAYWKLSKEDRKILFLRHADSREFQDIANELSLGSEDAARMRHKRAIKRLVNRIGGFKPFKDNDYDEVIEPTSSGADSAGSE